MNIQQACYFQYYIFITVNT